MAECGQLTPQSLVKHNLFGCVHNMIITPDHGVNSHGNIVNYDYKIVCWRAVTSGNDKIIQLLILEDDITLYNVFKDCGSICLSFKSDNGIVCFERFFSRQVPSYLGLPLAAIPFLRISSTFSGLQVQ